MGMKSHSIYFSQNTKSGGPSKRNGKLKYKLNLQLFAKMPKGESQIKHIMSNRKGHMVDSPINRSILEAVSNDERNYIGMDNHGNKRYAKIINGKQIWVSVRNNIIQDGGENETPFVIFFDKKGGYKK